MSYVRISYVRYCGGDNRNALKKTARIFYDRLRALLFAQPPVCLSQADSTRFHIPFTYLNNDGCRGAWSYIYTYNPLIIFIGR